MFKVGEYIVYGNSGVCMVDEIGTLDMGGISKDKIYYTLIPMYTKGSKIFTPIDNKKVIMRPIISEKEAWELIDDIKEIETLADIWESGEKGKLEFFKESMKKLDCRELVQIIKTLFEQKQIRIADGKKITASDEKFLKMAEEHLYGELAYSLKMDKEKAEDFITALIEPVQELEIKK